MPGIGLVHHRRRTCARSATTALADQFEGVKPGRAAQHRAYLTKLHLNQCLGEQLGQTVPRAPAHLSALQRIRRVGKCGGELRKITPASQLLHNRLNARALTLDLLWACLIGQPHQNVCEVVLGAHIFRSTLFLLGEEIIDLPLTHHDPAFNLTLAQTRKNDFSANVLTKLGKDNAVLLQLPAKLRDRQAAFLCDALDSAIKLHVIDAQCRFARELQLRVIDDQAFEHLLIQNPLRRQGRALLLELRLDLPDSGAKLVLGDYFIVHHRNDSIDQLNAVGRSGRLGDCGATSKEKSPKKQLLHANNPLGEQRRSMSAKR